MDEQDDERPSPARDPGRSVWLRPGGISAIAGVAAVVVSAIGVLIAIVPGMGQARPTSKGTPSPSENGEVALFVYGSSMPGQSRYDEIEEYVVEVEKDAVDGLLYDSGLGYPLAKFGPGDEIPGFVLWLDPDTATDFLRQQTQLESGLFDRVPVRTRDGVSATAYEWIAETDGFPRIERWDGSTANYGAYVDSATVRVGDCFGLTSYLETVITTWCGAPHGFEVYFAASTAEANDEKQADQRCGSELANLATDTVDASALRFQVLRPESEPGLLVCAAYTPDELLTGPLTESTH